MCENWFQEQAKNSVCGNGKISYSTIRTVSIRLHSIPHTMHSGISVLTDPVDLSCVRT